MALTTPFTPMAKISKIQANMVVSTTPRDHRFDFWFSDDLAKWMPKPKPERPDRRIRHGEFRKRLPAKGKCIAL